MNKMTASFEQIKSILEQTPDLFQQHPELLELVSLSDNTPC